MNTRGAHARHALSQITRNLVAVERSTRTHSKGDDEAEGYTIGEDGGAASGRGRTEEEEYLTREIVEETRIRGPARSTIVDQLIGAGSSKGKLPATAVESGHPGRAGSSSSSSRMNARTAALIGQSSGTATAEGAGENSFHHESSFVLNPLKKRTTVPATRGGSAAVGAQASGKGKSASNGARAAGAYGEMDLPDVPPLQGADKATQEALVIEDVLYALQVSSSCRPSSSNGLTPLLSCE